jgi:hypothetical protein
MGVLSATEWWKGSPCFSHRRRRDDRLDRGSIARPDPELERFRD